VISHGIPEERKVLSPESRFREAIGMTNVSGNRCLESWNRKRKEKESKTKKRKRVNK
jgi:hypothetical protein